MYKICTSILGNKNGASGWDFDLQYAGFIFVLIPGKAEILMGLEKDVHHSGIVLKAQVLPNLKHSYSDNRMALVALMHFHMQRYIDTYTYRDIYSIDG